MHPLKPNLANDHGGNATDSMPARQRVKTAMVSPPHCDPASCCEANTSAKLQRHVEQAGNLERNFEMNHWERVDWSSGT
jgi:hypothetical protein